jgi:hypothetical protein
MNRFLPTGTRQPYRVGSLQALIKVEILDFAFEQRVFCISPQKGAIQDHAAKAV